MQSRAQPAPGHGPRRRFSGPACSCCPVWSGLLPPGRFCLRPGAPGSGRTASSATDSCGTAPGTERRRPSRSRHAGLRRRVCRSFWSNSPAPAPAIAYGPGCRERRGADTSLPAPLRRQRLHHPATPHRSPRPWLCLRAREPYPAGPWPHRGLRIRIPLSYSRLLRLARSCGVRAFRPQQPFGLSGGRYGAPCFASACLDQVVTGPPRPSSFHRGKSQQQPQDTSH